MNDSNSLINEKEIIPIPNMWSGNCFGCSSKNKYGLQMTFYYTEKRCISHLSISENYCGFEGLVHGGIIATILDEIAACTITYLIQKLAITQSVKIHYVKPVYVNQKIIAESMIKDYKENFVTTEAIIKNEKGDILAKSEANWIVPAIETIAKITKKEPQEIKNMLEKMIEPIGKIKEFKNKD